MNKPLDYLSELPQARPHIHETRTFPDGFLWGSATSSHQVEGGTKNDWTAWEKEKGRVLNNDISASACEHYDRYEADFDLAQKLGQNSHRFSVEWSRIEPEEGKWNEDELQHYRAVLESLKRRNMKTMLTVWHFTLPEWFAKKGGWRWRGSTQAYLRFLEKIGKEFGGLVDYWITMNEPMVYIMQSYNAGVWPPGERNLYHSWQVFRRLTKTHNRAYRLLHDMLGQNTQVGVAKNVITFEPYRKESVVDTLFVWFADKLFNRQFFWRTRGAHDFIGMNYYFHYRVKYVPTKLSQFFYEVHTENREVSDLGWEINTQAIFDALMSMHRFRLPIIITEHGVANADDGKRPRVIVGALKEVYHAIQSGVDVRGYFHWSLLDNFEWEKGYSGRFGLIAVDYKTQKRTPRRSAYVYAHICKENGVPHNLLRFVGHGVRW